MAFPYNVKQLALGIRRSVDLGFCQIKEEAWGVPQAGGHSRSWTPNASCESTLKPLVSQMLISS